METDHVDKILAQWKKERPDLDPMPMGIIGRIFRLHNNIQKTLKQNFKQFDLQSGTFDLLATLRRKGPPFRLTPTQLQVEMMLSSGATTHRIDLLETKGLVERHPDPDDRRGTLVALTSEGKQLIDNAVEAHLAIEHSLLVGLTPQDQEILAALLRKMAIN